MGIAALQAHATAQVGMLVIVNEKASLDKPPHRCAVAAVQFEVVVVVPGEHTQAQAPSRKEVVENKTALRENGHVVEGRMSHATSRSLAVRITAPASAAWAFLTLVTVLAPDARRTHFVEFFIRELGSDVLDDGVQGFGR